MRRIILPVFCFLFITTVSLSAQISVDDYNRADSALKFNELVYHAAISPEWIDSTYFALYMIKTQRGNEYILVDAERQKKTAAFDQERLCEQINKLTGKAYKPYSVPLSDISFSKDLKE